MNKQVLQNPKYECIYLQSFENGSQAKAGICNLISNYSAKRPHRSAASWHPLRHKPSRQTL